MVTPKFFLSFLLVVVVVVQGSPPFQLDNQRGLPDSDLDLSLLTSSTRARLPPNVIPINYDLTIITILETNPPEGYTQFTAPGEIEIQVQCLTPTDVITLHSKEIDFTKDNVTIRQSGQAEFLPIVSVQFDEELETVTIKLENPLGLGYYMVAIRFLAKINEGTDGLYQSSYIDDEGHERFLATTQFEKTGARKAFPCFDEPALRATFSIKIGYKQKLTETDTYDYHALSNMEPDGTPVPMPGMADYVLQFFEPTRMDMPTYLIAIIVSDFTSTASADSRSVKTWGPRNQMLGDTGLFSANAASKALAFFSEYFDIEYHLPKLDSVAIPDFAAGAMENWGLNTYRVPTLLFVSGDMTQFERWRQAAVVAHEVAHSWFGNQVTVTWWNDLWLKEGFARYLQFHGVDGGVEEGGDEASDDYFGSKERMVLDTVQLAMEADVGTNTHAVRGDSTTEIQSQNSRIIYEKGASLIRMMEAFLNNGTTKPTTLQTGLHQYLMEHAYDSANQDELFETLQSVADAHGVDLHGKTVKGIMDTWTVQDGFPLVRISWVAPGRIFASQEKFIPTSGPSGSAAAGTWEIPVAFHHDGETPSPGNDYRPKAWIGANQPLISIPVTVADDQWILVNPGAMSYYRVMYDSHFFDLLNAQLLEVAGNTEIPTASRSQLLDDYFNFAFHSYAPMGSALDLTKFLGTNEKSYPVWTTALTHLRKLYNFLRAGDGSTFTKFETYLSGQIEAELTRLMTGTEPLPGDDGPVGWMLKALLLDWGCALDHPQCGTTTEELMDAWVANPSAATQIQADIQPMVLCAAYRRETVPGPTWREFMEEQYDTPSSSIGVNQHRLLYSSRGCVLNIAELEALLETTIDPVSKIPVAHRKALILQIAGREDTVDETLTFIELNYVNIISRLGDDAISTAIRAVSTYASSPEIETRIQKFHDDHEHELAEGLKTSILDSIVIIQQNREWNDQFSGDIGNWLDSNLPKGPKVLK